MSNTVSSLSPQQQEFWDRIARTYHWFSPWQTTQSGTFEEGTIKWFEEGTTNLAYNCLDRHLEAHGDKTAIIWEPNLPTEKPITFSYRELHARVVQTAAALVARGIQKGDRVCLYLPMIPDLPVLMLACARIGAVHTVVFAGFSARSLHERIVDSGSKLVFTSTIARRGPKEIPLKEIVDEAVSGLDVPVICVDTPDWQQEVADAAHTDGGGQNDGVGSTNGAVLTAGAQPLAMMQSEDPLFILYTSGSTGKPKGLLHTTGGYMVNAGHTFREVFDYQPDDIYWCTADIGWITGHTYLVYGPLLQAATVVMFEGVPTYPDPARFWQIIERHRVSLFYTAPTVIRALEKEGEQWPLKHNLSSLRVLGTVGEPINEEAWYWYERIVGQGACPIVDTWWQTETGAIMISARANKTRPKPGYATYPLEGIEPCLMSEEGIEQTDPVAEGYLCIKTPWPSMARSIWGDHQRYLQTYFEKFPGMYMTGDGARREAHGMYRITGRVDDVINVSGHRLGTAEIEDAIDEHQAVIESAVVGIPHAIKGQCIYAFVILQQTNVDADDLEDEIRQHVSKQISPIAKPEYIQFVSNLPKTRSGKIMRRILRAIAEGTEQYGDVSTLLDPALITELKQGRVS